MLKQLLPLLPGVDTSAAASAATAVAAAAGISDYSAIVQAISVQYNLPNIVASCIKNGKDSNGWERRTNPSL